MRGTVTQLASLRSSTVLNFDFPYSGGSTAELTIQRSPQGTRLYLQVTKGQFVCHDSSKVEVKFDQAHIQSFSCLPASPGMANVIFLEPSEDLIAGMKATKKMVIEATFYGAGPQQMTFSPAGLNW
jgi:hypothetical protein